MLRALLHGPAKKTYCGTGLLLAGLLPFYYTHLAFPSEYPGVICVASLAALSFVFAFLQEWVDLPPKVKTRLAWSYGAGTVLTMSNWPWLHDLFAIWVRDDRWIERLGLIDLAFPVAIALPVGVVFLGVFRYPRKWPERAYLLGGLCLVFLFVVEAWCNLFRSHFLGNTSFDSYQARFLRMPACLVVGTLGMLLGCLPQWSHRPSRIESAMTYAYLAGVVTMALGIYSDDWAFAAPLPAMLAVFVPASFLTRRWITSAFGARTGRIRFAGDGGAQAGPDLAGCRTFEDYS
ncbi:MAG: hypothetical protein WBL61_15080 [Bryobacteraceae bacterium]